MNGTDTGITHFTSQPSAVAILDGWRRDLVEGDKRQSMAPGENSLGPLEVNLRLYSRWGTNDPLEQKLANSDFDIVRSKNKSEQYRIVFPDDVYMLCGSKPQNGISGETTDRLEMWRAYGDDGRGVALTTWWNDRELGSEGLEIIEIEYFSEGDFGKRTAEIQRLYEEQKDQTKSRTVLEDIRRRRMSMVAGYKLKDYENEQEIRLVCFLGDESGAVRCAGRKELHFDSASGRLRTYIERPVRLGVTLTGLDITLGPRMPEGDAQHWVAMGQWMLAQMGISGGKVRQSTLKYIG